MHIESRARSLRFAARRAKTRPLKSQHCCDFLTGLRVRLNKNKENTHRNGGQEHSGLVFAHCSRCLLTPLRSSACKNPAPKIATLLRFLNGASSPLDSMQKKEGDESLPLLLVEARGIEPLSEKLSARLSTSVVGILTFPPRLSCRQDSRFSSPFIPPRARQTGAGSPH